MLDYRYIQSLSSIPNLLLSIGSNDPTVTDKENVLLTMSGTITVSPGAGETSEPRSLTEVDSSPSL
jgi:hypothetical protein